MSKVVVCKGCGIRFIPSESRVKFCSRPCGAKWQHRNNPRFDPDKVERILWDSRWWRRYPKHKSRAHRVYYVRHETENGPTLYLHREKWKKHNGQEISKGYEISHKDGDPLNNDVDNLQCVTIADHRKHDARLGAYDKTPAHLERIRKTVLQRAIQKVCKQCGAKYTALRHWAMYCSKQCGALAYPFQPKHEYACDQCGKLGKSKKRGQRFCSGSCSARYREQAKRPGV